MTRPEANRLTRLGRQLSDELYARVQATLSGGEIHADQASAIVHAVEAIPASPEELPSTAQAPATLKRLAVDHLLIQALDHDAKALRPLGRRILDIVSPEVGEAAEAKALADEEAAAERRVTLALRDNGNGTSTGRFTIPTAAAEVLRKQLMALAAPTRTAALPDASALSWAGSPRSSTWAAPDASTPRHSASPWPCATRAAPPTVATCPRPPATPTTTSSGPTTG